MDKITNKNIESFDDTSIFYDLPKDNFAIPLTDDTVINEIDILKSQIEELKKPKYESGYLRAKFG